MVEGFVAGLLIGLVASASYIMSFAPRLTHTGKERRTTRRVTVVIERNTENDWELTPYNEWSATVLDLDILTYGYTAYHALQMAEEATILVYEDDLSAGRLRNSVEPEVWDEAEDLREFSKTELEDLLETKDCEKLVVVTDVEVTYTPDNA